MKMYIGFAVAVALGSSALLMPHAAEAQSCTATAGFFQSGTKNDSLCNYTKQLVNDCNGATTFTTAPQAIYQVNLTAGANGVISVAAGSAFTPYVSLMSGACTSLSGCGSYEAIGTAPGTTATLPSVTGLAAGTYFMVVSDITEAVTCPNDGATFVLSVAGTLPVELKSFSVQ